MSISLTPQQSNAIRLAVQKGLKVCYRPVPMTLVEWADENFYLSSESSYLEGRWETLPYQVALMNCISHSDIREVNFVKSARVGYSQMIRAAVMYNVAHKQRNQILYQPTDAAAGNFMKAHIETAIRDVPEVKRLAPWSGKKHRDNTMDTKRFLNGKQVWVLGGGSAKNYREKSADNVYYDELSGFNGDVEREGDPVTLGDKRIEGSVFPKSVRGSTPKLTHSCLISKAASEAECFFRFHLPCPHCGEYDYLKWGGKGAEFGFSWFEDDPESVMSICKSCGAMSTQQQMQDAQKYGVWVCDETGTYTKDGLEFYNENQKVREAPRSVSFHIWTAYSPFTTWNQIVRDWLKINGDVAKLKTFINTTLGETWDDTEGESIDPNSIYARRERYNSQIPIEDAVLVASTDVQDDRLETMVVAYTKDEEAYVVTYERLYGDLSKPDIWNKIKAFYSNTYSTPSGRQLDIRLVCIDSGGHYTDEVYALSKTDPLRIIPIKGHSQTGKPIADFPRERNKKGVYLTMVGADGAKEVITSRLSIQAPGPGYIHFPVDEKFDGTFFEHLTNERRVVKYQRGRKVIAWDAKGRRNEPFDCSVYALAAVRILQQYRGVDLNDLKPVIVESAPQQRTRARFRFR